MQNEVGKVQSKGRFGDTMLVHMNPIEVKAISDQVPGGLTTNPDTGLPEAFLPLALGMLGGYGAGAMGIGTIAGLSGAALGSGLGSFTGSMLQGDEFKDAALGGLTSFGLGSMLAGAGSGAGGAAKELAAADASLPSVVSNTNGVVHLNPLNYPSPSTPGIDAFTNRIAQQSQNFGPFRGAIEKPSMFENIMNKGKSPYGGWGKVAEDAVTANPYGTAAAGIGLLGGGGGALMSPGEMPVVASRAKKDYGDMSEKFPSPAREYRKPGIDYRPGVDPEFSYFNPQNVGYAVGGQAGYSYDKGTNTYDFNRTSMPSLTPSVPTPEPASISIAGKEVGVAPQVIREGRSEDSGMPGLNAPKGGIGLDTAKNISSAVTSPVGRLAGLALPGVGTLSSIANIAANNTANTALGIGGINFNPFSANAAMDAVNRTGVGDADFRNEDGTFTPNKNNIQTRLHDSAGSPRGEHGFQSNDSGNSGDRGGSGGYGGGQTDAGNDTGSRGFYANGGQTQGPDPLIMGAVAAIMGSHPEPQQAIAAFVQVHGPEAFTQLRQQVIASASADQRGQEGIGGLIEGPGTGTSDSIPGQITQNGQPVEDIKVSNGEYILPEKAVEAFPQEKAGLDQFVANATGARPNNA